MWDGQFMQAFFALFFLLTLLFTVLAVYGKVRQGILSIIYAHLIWTGYLYLATEVLSIFSMVRRRYVLLVWIVYAGFLLAALWKGRRDLVSLWEGRKGLLPSGGIAKKGLLLTVCLLLGLNAYIAMHTVPYNWDSMTYHLPRIMYWIQNRSVSYFDTNISRQLISPVLAEYINLHLFCLTGLQDIYANMVQNVSEIFCTVFIIGALRRVHVKPVISYLGGFLFCAANIVAAEGCSTQVDLYSAMWTLAIVYLMLDIVFSDKKLEWKRGPIATFAALGAACGFLYHAKPSACIVALLVAVWAFWARVKKNGQLLHLAVLSGTAVLAALAATLTVFIRNYNYCGDILAAGYMSQISTGTFEIKSVLVNIVKNLATVSVWPGFENEIYHCANWFADLFHVNINAPEISFYGNAFYIQYSLGMDTGSASVILWVAAAAMIAFLTGIVGKLCRGRRSTVEGRCMDAFIFCGFLQLFVSMAAVRWQPWVARLLIPSFSVAVLASMIVFGRLADRCVAVKAKNIWIGCLGVLLYTVNLTAVTKQYLFNLEPVLDQAFERQTRFAQYFRANGEASHYMAMCGYLDSLSVSEIGLADNEWYQYPVLARYVPKGVKVYPVDLSGHPTQAGGINGGHVPDAIIAVNLPLDFEKDYWHGQDAYDCGLIYDEGHSVWVKKK